MLLSFTGRIFLSFFFVVFFFDGWVKFLSWLVFFLSARSPWKKHGWYCFLAFLNIYWHRSYVALWDRQQSPALHVSNYSLIEQRFLNVEPVRGAGLTFISDINRERCTSSVHRCWQIHCSFKFHVVLSMFLEHCCHDRFDYISVRYR